MQRRQRQKNYRRDERNLVENVLIAIVNDAEISEGEIGSKVFPNINVLKVRIKMYLDAKKKYDI